MNEMKVVYIFRPKGKAFSIERVFKPVMDVVGKQEGVLVEESHSEIRRGFVGTLWANIRKYAKMSRTGALCHITCEVRYCAIFMRKSHTILTTHDTMSLRNSEAPWYARWYAYWFQFYFPMRRLKYLTCISEATKKELVSYFPWCENKLRIIRNPIDNAFAFKEKPFDAKRPVILNIGTKSNKNLVRVAASLQGLPCHLRIVGKLSGEQEKALADNHIDYSSVSNLTDEEIIREYENCDILSFPSLFEGFGMPIIEAQAVGRPVVTSNREPMQSVAGGGAVLVDPESVEDIRCGFLKLINDDDLRSKCIKLGLENIQKYRPETIARQYMDLYQEIEQNELR